MTYEQALQIAIEQLDDAVDYIRAMNKGFPRVQKQADEFASASDVLKEMQLHYEDSNTGVAPTDESNRSVATAGEWVGLTDEDIEEVFTFPWHYIPFARAVEAKLKEKNT